MTAKEAVQFMKEHKILSFKDGKLEITLHPDALFAPFPPEKSTAPVDVTQAQLDEPGRTGMTRRQQLDLLGQVYEADFKKR